MSAVRHDVVVYACHNCLPEGARLPRQWDQNGTHVVVHELPCSGKTDGQYLFHALEGGAQGVCVLACPKGECKLSQGNYRAEVRVGTVRRLLEEIGLDPERAELLHVSSDESPEQLDTLIRTAVERIGALGVNPDLARL